MIIIKLTKDNLDLLDAVAVIFNQYRIFYGKNSDLDAAKKFLHERITNKESQIFIAKDNKKIVGFMQLYQGFSSVGLRKICILNDLYIDENYRKICIGKSLIREAKNSALRKNITKITLTTAKINKQAQKLYESEGYKKEEEFFVYNLELNQ